MLSLEKKNFLLFFLILIPTSITWTSQKPSNFFNELPPTPPPSAHSLTSFTFDSIKKPTRSKRKSVSCIENPKVEKNIEKEITIPEYALIGYLIERASGIKYTLKIMHRTIDGALVTTCPCCNDKKLYLYPYEIENHCKANHDYNEIIKRTELLTVYFEAIQNPTSEPFLQREAAYKTLEPYFDQVLNELKGIQCQI